ncbi:hypothetical protein F0562_021165 [Nyssa sinensis]|uniref:Uncharacterized protein n=1 Tax=Nyssa sinensis TaxID=561372 RepID=A0A5J5BMD2_9ASTE|nr:hypothetical protein F0562_021165 [Nyssa sinensis]
MSANNFLGTRPPLFNGENYQVWVIKMKTYLKTLNLWEAVENDVDPAPLGDDPTIAQLKNYEEQKAKKPTVLTCLHSALSETILLSVMACETPKEIWEKLREEYEGSQRVKNVKLLTLKREFEMHKMKERETVKEYARKLMEIVNKIKLFGEPFPDSKIVEKMLISLPARNREQASGMMRLLRVLSKQGKNGSIKGRGTRMVVLRKGRLQTLQRIIERKKNFLLASYVKEQITNSKIVGSKTNLKLNVGSARNLAILRRTVGPRKIKQETRMSKLNMPAAQMSKRRFQQTYLWLLRLYTTKANTSGILTVAALVT